MNKINTLAALMLGMAALNPAYALDVPGQTQAPAVNVAPAALDHIVAVVNDDVITENEIRERIHAVAMNLRRENIALPPMDQLRKQVLDRLILEKATLQRAAETGIRVDDQMVNASIYQIAQQNHLSVDQLLQQLRADGVSFQTFRKQIHDDIVTQRLREREVDSQIKIPESEVDAFLAEQAGFTGSDTNEYELANIVLPIDHPDNAGVITKQAEDILARARGGEDFATLAATYSRSENAMTGGKLGWVHIQNLVPDLRKALEEHNKVGDVYLQKTNKAAVIYKVIGKRDGIQHKLGGGPVQETHVRHILIPVTDITPEGEVINRLNDIRTRIENGADFASMARLNSVDGSAARGGDLGWAQNGDMVPAFEKAMNALKPGEVSAPVKTKFGYHLIEVLDRRVRKNGDPKRMRLAARQALLQKKLLEATFDWQRKLRDEAYVDIRDKQN